MEQGKRRNSYTPEFKVQAVERMRAGGPVTALARELGVRRKFLYEWKHALEEGCGFPGLGHALNPARPLAGLDPLRPTVRSESRSWRRWSGG